MISVASGHMHEAQLTNSSDFDSYLSLSCEVVKQNYSLEVQHRSLSYPRVAEFSGRFIALDSGQPVENKLFLLCHLFGHTVQWQTSPKWRSLGLLQPEMPEFETYRFQLWPMLSEIKAYEQQASQYGLFLLHQAGIRTLDRWLSDWFYADWKYLERVYLEGWSEEKAANFEEKYFVKNAGALLEPLKPPTWTIPQEWSIRFAF